MRIKSIKFKLTTTNWKCHYCKHKLIGKEGFIHIKCKKDSGWYSDFTSNIRICWNCLTNLLKEFEKDREDKDERYLELTKKAIIRKLS